MMELHIQVAWLFLLAIPVACIAWTVTHEEIFKEPRDFCARRSKQNKTIWGRKFFYVFICEYCFSHYVTVLMLIFTGYKFLLDDWRGYVLAGFSIVWIANIYMALFALIKVDVNLERLQYKNEQEEAKKNE
ncbi:hypothetical protein [Mucilaginibacter sp.]|uniref:hypothetical protein n=1 Tax=Mucilaginibacter sp. TaxID=1882438 RepID=UPI0026113CFA|nr:hypothetical protein [Mucilaginibacter sp.]MDB4927325.1 hypothetical protein [Mucilaginibacter sp.]